MTTRTQIGWATSLALALALCMALGGCAQPEAAPANPPADATPQEEPQEETPEETPLPSESQKIVSAEANKDLTLDDIPDNVLISLDELLAMMESDDEPFVLDIRAIAPYKEGHIPPAKCLSAGRKIELNYQKLPTDQRIVLVGKDNNRVAETWQTLVDAGFDGDLINALDGGMETWNGADLELKDEPKSRCVTNW